MNYSGERRTDRLVFKWQTTRRHFVNHDAEGEQVCARVQFLTVHLFWRHEGDGSRGGARGGEILSCYGAGFEQDFSTMHINGHRHFCQAEVKYLDMPALRQEEIGWLNIAMYDSDCVYRLQGVGYLSRL